MRAPVGIGSAGTITGGVGGSGRIARGIGESLGADQITRGRQRIANIIAAYREHTTALVSPIHAPGRTSIPYCVRGLLRQSVFGRLAGYEDVNDADRSCRDRAITGAAASTSQMGWFETKWPSRPENLAALAALLSRPDESAEPGRIDHFLTIWWVYC
jgi:hypothetical protein